MEQIPYIGQNKFLPRIEDRGVGYTGFMGLKGKTAIVLGATGLTGGLLLHILLKDDRYKKVKLFSRSSVEIDHPKLEEHLIDVLRLKEYRTDFMGDAVFCCIGTTKAKTPHRELYKKIDYGIPVDAAQLCIQNGIHTFIVVSVLGADSKSAVFYNRTKGEMEDEVLQLGIHKTHILQPSLIGGVRREKRTGERLAKYAMKVLGLVLLGPLKKYRSIHPSIIAKCMVWLANNDYNKARIESDKIMWIVNNP